MSIRSKKKMNNYNSQSPHNRHSHKKTTLVADNHLKTGNLDRQVHYVLSRNKNNLQL